MQEDDQIRWNREMAEPRIEVSASSPKREATSYAVAALLVASRLGESSFALMKDVWIQGKSSFPFCVEPFHPLYFVLPPFSWILLFWDTICAQCLNKVNDVERTAIG